MAREVIQQTEGVVIDMHELPLTHVVRLANGERVHLTAKHQCSAAKVGDRVLMEKMSGLGPSWYAREVIGIADHLPALGDWQVVRLDDDKNGNHRYSIIRHASIGPVAYLTVDADSGERVAALIEAAPKLAEVAFRLSACGTVQNDVRCAPNASDIVAARRALRDARIIT